MKNRNENLVSLGTHVSYESFCVCHIIVVSYCKFTDYTVSLSRLFMSITHIDFMNILSNSVIIHLKWKHAKINP